MTKFQDLQLSDDVLKGITDQGFEEAFPIQEAVIPVLLSGRDVVGQAHTGSGKTAAFALAMLEKIQPKQGIQGLIMAPTRELAMQISDEIKKFGKHTGIRTATVYGGQGMGIQLDALHRGVEIVVATPGRLIDHLKRGSIELRDISHIVLDEADTMLDMGFVDDISFILDLAPEDRVMSLFSATMPTEILRLSEEYLNNPKQFLLDSTKYRTRDVAKFLHQEKYNAVAIEGDMSQHRREQSMGKFRSGKADILVATDVASRGIDVPRVELVVNYDVPNQEMAYFHRIGRTARAGAKGRAITFVSYSSVGDWNLVKRQIKVPITDLNKEMGIQISIPDPLKRQTPSRRYGGQSRSNYSRGGRSGGYGGSRGGGNPRDDRGGRRTSDRDGNKNSYGGRSRW